MHEVSIAQSILKSALFHLDSAGSGRIRRIHCSIGSLTGVEISSLEFCFPFVVEGTAAERAELVLTEVLAHAECPECKRSFDSRSFFDPCPYCDHWPLQLSGGRDMLLTSIDICEEVC